MSGPQHAEPTADTRIVVAGQASPERDRAAAALRRLGHALVGHDADAALLERIAEQAEATAAVLEAGRPRQRAVEQLKQRLWQQSVADGEEMSHFPDCVVSGSSNPMGVAMHIRRSGARAVAQVRLGLAFEGAPQRAHGGVVAAVLDDAMGYVLLTVRQVAFTGRLTISYGAPVPVGVDLDVVAWLAHRSGRKLTMRAELSCDGTTLCTAEGLFIAVRAAPPTVPDRAHDAG